MVETGCGQDPADRRLHPVVSEALPVGSRLPYADVAEAALTVDDEMDDEALGRLLSDFGLDRAVELLVCRDLVGAGVRHELSFS